MACGCPVVTNRGANVEWLLGEQDCLLAEPTVEALSDALISVLSDPKRREQLSDNGMRAAQRTSWAREAEKLGDYLSGLDDES